MIVSDSVNQISITATPVNQNARVSGAGTIDLSEGTNVIEIVVTAQTGATRTYKLTVVRGTAVNDPVSAGASSTMKGDMNGDGKITALDIIKLQRLIVGLDTLTNDILAVADVNGDGKVTALDIVKVQRHIVGLETIQ